MTTETALVKVKPEADAQIIAFYNEALGLRAFAEARIIATVDDLKPANDDLLVIRRLKKAMEGRRKDYLTPFQEHVKEVNEAYKALMEPIETADKITSDKMLAFTREQARRRAEAEAINREKLELARREETLNGEHTVDLTPIEVPEAPKRVSSDMGSSGQRDNWKWELIDLKLVPVDYLMINAGILTPVVKASKGKLVIPGIRI